MNRAEQALVTTVAGLRPAERQWPRLQPARAVLDCIRVEAENRTGFLWLTVAFGAGILGFFHLAHDPPGWIGPAGAIAAALLALGSASTARFLARIVMMACLGFGIAHWRTGSVATPMLDRARTIDVRGFVEAIDDTPQRSRLLVRVVSMEGLAPSATPYRVKVGLRGMAGMDAGAPVQFRAHLAPPSGPALPGGFDFRRDAYFKGLGAIGYAIGPVRTWEAPSPPPRDLQWQAQLDNARNALTRRIASTIGGSAGAIAAALVTGKRALIPDEANDALRLSGLYHIVSISGLHMVLAAGVLFWLVRAGLALWPRVALRMPVKKLAAAFAMLGAIAYCLFAGSEVATIRSLIMTLVMLGAILIDRPALAMRNLALSALFVLSLQPEAILGPSFQMSYAAVAALIASQRLWNPQRQPEGPGKGPSLARRFALGFAGIIVTTLVASMATTPFSAFHFYRVNPFGLIGNSLGIPLVSLVVMPAAVAGCLLQPFGMDEPVWHLMGLGIRGMMTVATWVAGFEHASLPAPALRHSCFAAFVGAMLVFLLPVTRLRWLGVVPLAIWIVSLQMPALPDIIVHENGHIMLARGQGGAYRVIASGGSPDFVVSQWLPALGDARAPRDASLRSGVRCDRLGCTVRLHDGRWLALSMRPEGLREDCLRADLVVTPLRHAQCPNGRPLVDGRHLQDQGTQWLWASSPTATNLDAWQREGTRPPGRGRPWHVPYRGADARPSDTVTTTRKEPAGPLAYPGDATAAELAQ